ncbi:hypothetical protein ACIBG7_41620 [Nonomuraea sp. NPDC050328]|uniref:hypothetical protein n=1 Tax=Nonomuraea sp. NPDC050328 TaxID=3364361 RepID=UPI00379E9A7D
MIEVQIQHILSCLRLLRDADAATVEVTPSAMHRYTARIHPRLRKAVWSQGGCQSWHLDGRGVNTTL